MVPSLAGVWLAAALMVAPDQQGSGQAPAQNPAQAPPPAAQAQAGQPEKPAEEPRRTSKRKPRGSRRPPSASGQGGFEEGRPTRDGGPSRQEASLVANVLGGYDDNLTAGLGSGSGTSPDAMVSGSTLSVDGTLDYFRGNNLRSLRINTAGSLMGYPGNLDNPAPAGSFDLSGKTPVGRDVTVSLSERVAYSPLFNVYASGAGGLPLPPDVAPATPTAGLFARDSWSSDTSASIDRRWGRRDTTALGYAYRRQEFLDDDYGDNAWHEFNGSYRRVVSSYNKAGADYRYRNGEYADSSEFIRPTTEHRIEGIAEFAGAPSRRRRYTLSLGAGAGYLASVGASGASYQSWLPVGHGHLRFDVSPTWYWEGGYRRDLSLLQGVTDNIYATDSAYLTTGGFVASRASLRVGATYSNWVTPLESGVNDSMNIYGATLGIRVMLTGSMAATAGYYYYYHRYSNPGSLPEGFPAEYDRQAVRVGLTIFVPLAGASAASPLDRR